MMMKIENDGHRVVDEVSLHLLEEMSEGKLGDPVGHSNCRYILLALPSGEASRPWPREATVST